MRGTKCAENNAVLILTYAGVQVAGYMLNVSYSKSAAIQTGVRLSFQLVITSRKYLGFSDDFSYYVGAGKKLMSDPMMQKLLDDIAGKDGTGSSDADSSNAANKASNSANGGASAGTT